MKKFMIVSLIVCMSASSLMAVEGAKDRGAWQKLKDVPVVGYPLGTGEKLLQDSLQFTKDHYLAVLTGLAATLWAHKKELLALAASLDSKKSSSGSAPAASPTT